MHPTNVDLLDAEARAVEIMNEPGLEGMPADDWYHIGWGLDSIMTRVGKARTLIIVSELLDCFELIAGKVSPRDPP